MSEPTSTSLVIGIAFAGSMLLAAGWDLRTRTIPNGLTISGALAAPLLWGILGGLEPALGSLLGGGAGLALGMTLFALGAIGGGDAKLLMVLGAFVGSARLVTALIAIGVFGGLLALAVAIVTGRLLPVLARTWSLGLYLVTLGRMGTRQTIDGPEAQKVPYGVVIAAGGLFTWFLAP